MARLPTPGADEGNWGTILNEYLEVARCNNGELKINTWANEAARPASPQEGQTGINLETGNFEKYVSGSWTIIEPQFKRDGTGAVVRSVNNKLMDIFSVKDFGAVGDGVTDDTVAIQNAFVNWIESGAVGTIYFPPGKYYITDEMTAGMATVSGGGTQTVAKHIKNWRLNDNVLLKKPFSVKGEYRKSIIIVDENFNSTDSNFIDSAVIRYESPSKSMSAGPVIQGLEFYSKCSRANRKKCPIAIKAINLNWGKISDILIYGEEYEWQNTGIHIENVNNSYFSNWRITAGLQYTQVDLWGNAGAFDLSTTTTIVSNNNSSPFVNPSGEADTFWNDKWIILSKGAQAAELMMVKTASLNAKGDDNTLNLDPAYAAQITATNLNISLEMVRGSTTANSNVLNLDSGVLTADDEGRMIHVLKAGMSTDANRDILSAYIKPGSISNGGKTCELVYSDGTTVANAMNTLDSNNTQHVLISPPVYIGQSAENSLVGQNNDTTMAAIHVEASRGGAQMLLEGVSGSYFTSGKTHGRWGHGETEQQVAECGYLMVFDHCKNIRIENLPLTWFHGVDGLDETCYGVRIFGARNLIKFDNYELYGSTNKLNVFDLNGSTSDCELLLGDGFNNILNWDGATNDRSLFKFNSMTNESKIHVRGSLKARETGTSSGFTDLLAPYKNRLIVGNQETTIENGAITITGGFATVDTQGGAATDDLDTINGGVPGQLLILNINTTGRSVVLKHGTGNIHTANATDITLDASRKYIMLICDNGSFRQVNF